MTALISKPASKIAIFIDAENTKPDFEALFFFCADIGTIEFAQIYGCHELLNSAHWRKNYEPCNFTPVYNQKGIPNHADMQITVDAIELVYTHPDIDTFLIASLDRDFIPLVMRLRAHSKTTIGISSRHPPQMLRDHYNQFHHLLKHSWDDFEYCAHLFYLYYLENQISDGWALADEVLYAIPNPLQFLRRLHRLKCDSFIDFLKHCRFFNIHNVSANHQLNLPNHWLIRNPRDKSCPADSIRAQLDEHARRFFAAHPTAVVSGVPTLIHHFKKQAALHQEE